MNKLRLIKIFEIRGKIHPIEQLFIDLLDGIEEVSNNDYNIYKKDGELYFTYSLNNNNIYLYHIHTYFKTNFGDINERREILKYLLEKHLNITIYNIY